MYTPPTILVQVTYPGTAGEPSLFDVTVTSSSTLNPLFPSSGTLYDGWCLDTRVTIGVPGTYSGGIYSTYETTLLSNAIPALGNPGGFISNLDSINWLMGFYTGTNAGGYTYGDVQAAMWTLMGQDWHVGAAVLGAVDQTRIDALVSQALANDGYVPDAGEAIGVIIDPVTSSGVHLQPLIIETKAAKLGDHVWEDRNANGIQDAGEAGIGGAAVNLVRDLDGSGTITADEVLASTFTDANGDYSFKGLTPGLNYQVQFTLPSGYDALTPRQADGSPTSGANSDGLLSDVVVLAPGEYNRTIDAGFYKYASIGDKVWTDVNGNGLQDIGDNGVAGVTVNLCDANGNIVTSTTTDANGLYHFFGLVPSTYSVQFVAPTGFQFTTQDAGGANTALDVSDSDANVLTGKTGNYTLLSGDAVSSVDAGLVPNAAPRAHLGDKVFEDKNGNGLQDVGDNGIAGVTVQLCDVNGNPIAGAVTTTDVNGVYGFDVAPGTYSVKVTPPQGYFVTTQDAVGNTIDASDSDINAQGKSGNVTLVAGETNNTVDAGLYRGASLGDRVWIDTNGNGLQDAGEGGASGVIVQLCDAAGNPVSGAVTTTDANGNYQFINLAPGTYSVQFTAPGGYQFTGKDANGNTSDTADSDAGATGKTDNVTLASGDVNTTLDAGLVPVVVPQGHIGDFVFEDKNANGVQDAGEAGIGGVTVALCDANGNILTTTTTNANGGYGFDVAPGTYGIKVTLPNGYVATLKDAAGNTLDATDSDIDALGKSGTVTVASGQTDNTLDAGLYRTASLGDKVWLDSNANGIQDAGEGGVAGVNVQLCDAAGNPIAGAVAVTDVNGNYLFNNLVPGTYSVKFTAPAGYQLTTQDANGNLSDAADSDANAGTGKTGNYTLASGDVNLSVDAGLTPLAVPKGHIGDFVWDDKNGNGVQDAGEAGLVGVTVQLCDANGNIVATTTTGANGSYGFDVDPGTYAIKVTAPAGYFSTVKDAAGNTLDATDSDIDTTGKSGTVTVASGQTVNTLDAGLYKGATLGDKVWFDTNGNGLQDGGEAGAGNVTVNLCDANGTILDTRVTDASGNYQFINLAPGTYSVKFTAPAGYQLTTQDANGNLSDGSDSDANTSTGKTGNYTLASGDVNLTVDAGLTPVVVPKGHIGDFVFEDKNANGVQDAGEAGIGGVTVQLCDALGNPVAGAVTTTDANGGYGFDVAPGTYGIKVTLPAGYLATLKDAAGNTLDATDSDIDATGKSSTVTVASGQTNNTLDAGLYRTASLGDKVWVDGNANGIQDGGEAGLAGVGVQLCDAAGNPIAGAVAVTDVNGNYLFNNLVPGTYSVKFTAPAGYFLTGKDANGNLSDAADSDADTTTGKTGNYTLASGDQNLTVDAGVYQKAHIGDFVWDDKNGNGVQDAGEAGLGGVTVALCDANGNIITTTTTSATGAYGFDVAPGTYAIKVTAPAGYFATVKDAAGNTLDGTDSDIDTTGKSGTITVTSGQVNNTLDAGLYKGASLGDKVWLDANGNGLQDAGEGGASGVQVQLCDAAGNPIAGAVATTDVNGNYLFSNLAPGSYSVKFTAPAGYQLTTQDANGNLSDSTDSDANAATGKTGNYTLASGDVNLTVDAGITPVAVPKAHIGDFVWEDKNANGVQDAGEAGIGGVTVNLCDALGNIVGTTTTAANGSYGFDVAPGTYAIKVTAPAGYFVTTRDASANTLDATDSDIDAATGKSGNYTLVSGQTNNTVDAGLYRKVSLGDKVWNDTNGNGLQDAGEAGMSGVTVNLCDAAGNIIATKTTDASGNYLFTDLVPGTYSVKFTAPTGYQLTTKDANSNLSDTLDSDADATTGKTGNYTLASGDNNLTVDAGMVQCTVKIGDKVWADTNKNGLQDVGEAGVAGVQVKLTGAGTDNVLGTADDTVRTTTTDANGNYLFSGVTFGTYKVGITAPAGYSTTTANVGANDSIDSDVVTTTVKGATNLIVNGSFENPVTSYGQFASISGWTGLGDTIEVGKATSYGVTGASGTQVVELDANIKGAGTGLYQDVQTAAGQTYQLSVDVGQRAGCAPGTNTVEVWWAGAKVATIDPGSTVLSTYTLTVKGTGGLDRLTFKEQNGDDDGAGGIIDNVKLVTCATVSETAPIVVNACVDNLTVDAGLVTAHKAGIDVQKYVSGATCTTTTSTGSEGASCSYWKTAYGWDWSTGSYGWAGTGCKTTDTFNQVFGCNVTGGTKTILQLLGTTTGGQEGMMREACAAYLNACHGSVDYAYGKDQVTAEARYCLSSGKYQQGTDEFSSHNNLGCNWTTTKTTYSCVVDTALFDADAPPGLELTVGGTAVFTYIVKNTGDAALKNVSLTDDRIATVTYVGGDVNNNGLLDVTESWTYTARETVQAGLIKNVGTVNATDTVDGISSVTASDPAYYTGAGVTPGTKGSIGDRVWEDKNYNGVQDAGEVGIGGVKVTLKGAGADGVFGTKDDTVSTTVTASNGAYEFTNLAAGKYQAFVTNPAGYSVTKANTGANDAVDSDIDTAGATQVITLAAGEHNLTVDAGLYRKASVGDFVWEDKNHNWVQDAGEPGIGGIAVKLLDATGLVVATTKTDATGHYLFGTLDPGVYQLQFDKSNVIYGGINMNGWMWGKKDQGTNDNTDSDVTGDGIAKTNVTVTDKFTLVSGQADMSRDAAITPIVIDLNGDGIHTVARADAAGAFDLFGNGHSVKSGWISSGDGFLAVDKNGNGKIDSIAELFGGTTKGAGYAQLAAYDSNHDGVVDAKDADFAKLLVWQDSNGNHATDAGELVSLAQAGIASLAVAHTNSFSLDAQGNVLGETSSATLDSGKSVAMTDVYFNVSSDDAKAAGVNLPSLRDLLGDDHSLDCVLGSSGAKAAHAESHAETEHHAGGELADVLRKLHTVSHDHHAAHAH